MSTDNRRCDHCPPPHHTYDFIFRFLQSHKEPRKCALLFRFYILLAIGVQMSQDRAKVTVLSGRSKCFTSHGGATLSTGNSLLKTSSKNNPIFFRFSQVGEQSVSPPGARLSKGSSCSKLAQEHPSSLPDLRLSLLMASKGAGLWQKYCFRVGEPSISPLRAPPLGASVSKGCPDPDQPPKVFPHSQGPLIPLTNSPQ